MQWYCDDDVVFKIPVVSNRCASVGDPASEVLKDACQDLMLMCQHVRRTFDKAVQDFKMSKTVKYMDSESD